MEWCLSDENKMVLTKIPGLYTFQTLAHKFFLKTTIRNDFWETNFNHYSPGDCLIFRECFRSFHIQLGSVPAGLYRPLGLWVYACVKCGFYDFMLNPALERHTSLKNTCTKINIILLYIGDFQLWRGRMSKVEISAREACKASSTALPWFSENLGGKKKIF